MIFFLLIMVSLVVLMLYKEEILKLVHPDHGKISVEQTKLHYMLFSEAHLNEIQRRNV